jgi:hypothetical protein
MKKTNSRNLKGILETAFIVFVIILSVVQFAKGQQQPGIALVTYAIILLQARVQISKFFKPFPGLPYVTRIIRTLFYFIPVLFLPWPSPQAKLWGIPLGIAVGLLFVLGQYEDLKLIFSKDVADLFAPITKVDRIRDSVDPVLSAVAQEYFYKQVLLLSFVPMLGIGAIALSALLFTIEHEFQFNSAYTYDKKDYVFQFFLSGALGLVYFFSGSLLGAILGHAIYNTPSIILTLRTKVADNFSRETIHDR